MENTTEIQEIIQTPYEQLLEERLAYQEAGMDQKVAEWDYRIKLQEIAGKYSQITFEYMAKEFGIEGLQKAVDAKKAELAKKRNDAKEKALEICGDFAKAKKISESKLYDFIDRNQYRFDNEPEIKAEILRIMTPKLSGTAQKMFRQMFNIKDMEQQDFSEKVAFIKIERVSDYTADDNPPMQELVKLVRAREEKIFTTLFVAFPMIDEVKQVDPIFFGVVQNPNKEYDNIESFGSDFFMNNSITLDRLNKVNLGAMFRIGQWE